MKKNSIKWFYLVLLVMTIFISSCKNEEWDRHYNNTDFILSDKSLSEYIQSKPEMGKFYQMMEISGYDSILNESQTYTVWVPTDAALQSIDLADTSAVKNLVMNHVSRFTHPTSGVSSDKIYMLSKKFVFFTETNGSYFFGSNMLTGLSVSAKNGIVHEISGYAPYSSNIWEALDRIEKIDSMRTFFNSLTTIDEYDVKSNFILDYLASLDNEDSVYTAIFPTNKAWIKSYNSIKGYYKTRVVDGGFALQDIQTKFSIVKNNFFSNITNPTSYDSITSTWGNVFHDPSKLFAESVPIVASNGMIYLTDSMRFKATESWHSEIRIEAEETLYGRSSLNANVFNRNSEGTRFTTSLNRYIVVEPLTSSDISIVSVTFPIPNTLSAKYNIYCVFVPEIIANATSHKPYTANFFLDYVNAAGTVIKAKSLATNLTTDSEKITKLFVGQFEFPFCNIWDGSTTSVNVKLKVANAVKSSQTTLKSRTMRIDCIILEPVE